jgi:O-antigen/teichoic acid export membrane protein
MSNRTIAKFASFNMIGNLVPLLFAALCIPVLTRELGPERFGFLTLIWALIGYFGIFDLGISKALVYHSSRAAASDDPTLLAPGIRAGLQIVLFFGMLGMLVLIAGSQPLAGYLIKTSSQVTAEAATALIIIGLTIPATTVGNALRGALEGLSRFRAAAIIKVVTGSAFFVVPAGLALIGIADLRYIALIFFVVRVVAAVWCWLLICAEPLYLSSKGTKPTGVQRRELLSYGLWALVSSVISPLMVYGDRFIISGVFGAAVVGIYAILQETLGRSLFVAASFTGALQPGLTRADSGRLKKDYRNYERILSLGMLVFYFFTWLVAQPLAEWWLGKSLEEYRLLFLIFVIALFFNSLAQLPYALLLAKGRPDLPAKYHVAEFVFYMPLCIWATHNFGLNGAAGAWTFRVVMDYGLLKWTTREIIR